MSFALVVLFLLLAGCGTTREHRATDQLLLSDAVDRSVSHIDFRPLSGEKVFLDTRYLAQQPTDNLAINTNYVISSIRQQMFRYGCLLQEREDDADFVVEARMGTLGSDGHDVNYGLPASNAMSAAANVISGTPALPALPDVSFARRSESSAAAKVALFAYRRESKEPVWQSGLSIGYSKASGRWILGIGPFQSGTIYEGTLFAGDRLKVNGLKRGDGDDPTPPTPEDQYRQTAIFDKDIYRKLEPPLDRSGAEVSVARDQKAGDEKPVR